MRHALKSHSPVAYVAVEPTLPWERSNSHAHTQDITIAKVMLSPILYKVTGGVKQVVTSTELLLFRAGSVVIFLKFGQVGFLLF